MTSLAQPGGSRTQPARPSPACARRATSSSGARTRPARPSTRPQFPRRRARMRVRPRAGTLEHMSRSIVDDAALRSEIEGLAALSLERLRERWRELYGTKAPQGFRREMLIRALAYQLQVRAYGGLPAGARRRLREIAAAARDGSLDPIAVRVGSGALR